MSWTYGDYDWDSKLFMSKRDELAELIPELDDYFDEVREDDHEGSCWDLINGLAMLLTSKQRTELESEHLADTQASQDVINGGSL